MKTDFNHCESVYWVFTQLCNDRCAHCYNNSGPKGDRIGLADCMAIIGNLPDRMDRLILSGGEPLADRPLLLAILDRLRERFGTRTQLMLQTNGDLLTEAILDQLIEKGITRFDIASIDRFHRHQGSRLDRLARLFEAAGVRGDHQDPLIRREDYLLDQPLSWGYWGATEDMWLGGNWARGRALETDNWKKDPNHNFCTILSGARNFLGGYEDIPQEISIQLWRINPCCPGTLHPLGDARKEKVAAVLARAAGHPAWMALHHGQPWRMGEHLGISEESARRDGQAYENICRYCDAFFRRHMPAPDGESDYFALPVAQSTDSQENRSADGGAGFTGNPSHP